MNNKISTYHLFIIFFLVSICGFIIETMYMLIQFNIIQDRGFLTLPLCPIYGGSVILSYLLLGTPKNGTVQKLISKYSKSYIPCYLYYFIFVTIIASLVEYLVGTISKDLMHVELWTYRSVKYNLNGHIALRYSLIWGLLITTFMSLLFSSLCNLIIKIKKDTAKTIAVSLAIILVYDYIFNILFLLRNGYHFDIIRILLD